MPSSTVTERASESHDSDIESSEDTLYDIQPDQSEAHEILEHCEQRLTVNLAQQRSVLTCYAQAHQAMSQVTTALLALETGRAAHSLRLDQLLLNAFMTVAEKLEDTMDVCETGFGSLQREATELQLNVRYTWPHLWWWWWWC